VLVVYLDIPAETAWQRISAAGELPPFLNTANPKETHRELHQRRAAGYRAMARIVIDSGDKGPEERAREIDCETTKL
jgi:shikimate kinase